ncbi:MAG: hypothetical protein ACTSQJ_09465 [Promethearchaeota archaeon]
MSTPVSTYDGPFSTNTLASKRFLIVYIGLIWASILPVIIEFYFFWKFFEHNFFLFIILFPLQIIIGYLLLIISALILAKISLLIVNLIHKPKEGVFRRLKEDKDFYYWSLRAVIKKWPIWLSRIVPTSFLDNIILKFFGVKTKFSNKIHNCIVDTEFIELEEDIIIGKGSVVKSSAIIGDFLVIKKIIIKSKVIIGANSYISPGTYIGSNTVIGAFTLTKFSQKLAPNSIYVGYPAKKCKTTKSSSNNLEEELKKKYFKEYPIHEEKPILNKNNIQKERKFVKKFHINLSIFAIIYISSYIIPVYGLIFYFFKFFFPFILKSPSLEHIFLNYVSLIIFLLTPLIIIVFILINLLIISILTKIFYRILKNFNLNEEYHFHWNYKTKDYNLYFIRSFLLRYLRRKTQRSIFPWILNPIFNFVGNCQIGKGTVIENGFIAKEFLKIGKSSYIGNNVLTDHLWDKNLMVKSVNIKENVIIPDLCCISPGTTIENNVNFFPLSITLKNCVISKNSFHYDIPIKRVSKNDIKKIFNIDINSLNHEINLIEDLKNNEVELNDENIIFPKNVITTNNIDENKFLWIYPLLMWLSLFPTLITFLFFFRLTSIWLTTVGVLLILPFVFILYYVIFLLYLAFISKLLLVLINLIHEPKEGIFKRTLRDKDYFFYCLRNTIKQFIVKVYNLFPLPWVKIFALKICNIKISTNSGILDSYIDTDFIEIKEDCILGEGSIIMSSMIICDYMLMKKVVLKEQSTIGVYSIVTPGTLVEKNAIIGMGCFTNINQKLEKKWVYIGKPVKKLKKI